MQVFIISIEEDHSPRLLKFLDQPFFQKGQLSFKKIGIKGSELSAKQYFEKAVKGRSQPLTPSELGCTLSHLEALQTFLVSDDDYAFILEDDAIFPMNFTLELLEKELKGLALPSNVLFTVGGIQMKECLKVRGHFYKHKFKENKILEVIPEFYHRACYAFAYIVDRKMAETLLAYHQPIRKADDWGYLYDFDASSHILMTDLIDHPVIEIGEKNLNISHIENERAKSSDIAQSKYGKGVRKEWSKLNSTKFYE